jgi:hypothetical protein
MGHDPSDPHPAAPRRIARRLPLGERPISPLQGEDER